MKITVEDIVRMTSYMSIIHHTKGRLRVKVNPQIKNEADDISLEDIEALPEKINGIEKLKINKIMGTITILYSNDIFPYELWEDLIAGNNIDDITKRVNKLYKEII